VRERRERVDRGRVGPVDIVQAQHQRAGGGEPLQQIAQRAMSAVAVARRGLAREWGQRRQRRGERAGVRQPEPAQPPLAELSQVIIECLRPERVGQVGLVLRGPRGEHRAALRRRALGEVGQQA
jgi:hypothetical protein